MTANLYDLLRKFADDVRPYVEECGQMSITVRENKSISIYIHGCADYSHGLRMMKGMGAKLDKTRFFDPHAPWSALSRMRPGPRCPARWAISRSDSIVAACRRPARL